MSLFKTEILCSKSFSFTLRSASLAISSCISTAVIRSDGILLERIIDTMPQPVPSSKTFAYFFGVEILASRTESVVKRRPFFFWMIRTFSISSSVSSGKPVSNPPSPPFSKGGNLRCIMDYHHLFERGGYNSPFEKGGYRGIFI